jgi:chromosome partitioning protein
VAPRREPSYYRAGVIILVAALKGGVGKTTTSVYLAALSAATKRPTVLIDADPQASAAEWLESTPDEVLQTVEIVEAPTDRLLLKALERVDRDEVAVVDSPPGQEQRLAKALGLASVAVVPTRVGGVETTSAEAVLDLMPRKVPSGMFVCSARTYTRDYQETVDSWIEAGVDVWGSVPERVAIAAGPLEWLSEDGLDAYRSVWRRALRHAR